MTGHPRFRWLFLACSLATAAVCARLGVWQIHRHVARTEANRFARIVRSTGFRPYPDSVPALAPEVGVVLRGSFDLDREFVIRGRAHDGAPGVEIATPFRIAGVEQAIIVLRGFVPSDDAMSVDLTALREPGERIIRGFLFPLPMDGEPLVRNNDTTWSRIPGAWIQLHFPYPVAAYALWQEKDSGMAPMPIRLGAPTLDKGPHLNYALQWFAFAIIFSGGGIVFAFRTREERGETREAPL
jgi:surfeit locus 1 family protein